jgi:hypothetical protein
MKHFKDRLSLVMARPLPLYAHHPANATGGAALLTKQATVRCIAIDLNSILTKP